MDNLKNIEIKNSQLKLAIENLDTEIMKIVNIFAKLLKIANKIT